MICCLFTYDVEFLPRWRDHVIYEVSFLVWPVLRYLSQVEAVDDFIWIHECVHVSVDAVGRVRCLNIELDLDKVLGVRADNEVYIVPIGQK